MNVINEEILKCGAELSRRAGEETRKIMLECGLSEKEVDEIMRDAFAWRYEEKP